MQEAAAGNNDIQTQNSSYSFVDINFLDNIYDTRERGREDFNDLNLGFNNETEDIIIPNNPDPTEETNVNITLSGDTTVIEGENATYKVSLTDDNGNPITALEDMEVSFTYTYTDPASKDDITEVKTVIVKAGDSEASFTVDDVYSDSGDKYQVAINSVTNSDQFEKTTIDNTAVETTISDETPPDNVNISLSSDSLIEIDKFDNAGKGKQPQITTLKDGGYVVTWNGEDNNANETIFVQQFNADGTKTKDVIELEALDNTTGFSQYPQITSLKDGGYVVTWHGLDSEGDLSVFLQQFKADGTKEGSIVQLEALNNTSGQDLIPEITSLKDGGYVVVWVGTNTNGEDSIYIQQFNKNGNKTAETIEFEAINNTNLYDQPLQISSLANGGYVITWTGDNSSSTKSIFAQQFNSDGTKAAPEIQLDHLEGTTTYTRDPEITSLKDGGYAITWQGSENRKHSIFVQQFDKDGNKVVKELINITEEDNATYTVSLIDDNGNPVNAVKDMTISFIYTYKSSTNEDITEVKNVIIKEGENKATFNVAIISDGKNEGNEDF